MTLRIRISKTQPQAVKARLGANQPVLNRYGDGVTDLGPARTPQPSKKAMLVAGNDFFVIDMTDPVVRVDDLGHIQWSEIPRSRSLPWLVDSGRRLKKLRVKGTIYKSGTAVDFSLDQLYFMSTRAVVMTFVYGRYEAGQYRMTELSVETMFREPGTNNVTAASVEFTLTQASDPPVPKPVASAPAPLPPAPPSPPSQPSTRIHTVAKGDSLWLIANHIYGNGSAWKRIADANHLKDANRIYPGQKLVIP